MGRITKKTVKHVKDLNVNLEKQVQGEHTVPNNTYPGDDDDQETSDEFLQSIYYDPLNAGSYSGLAKLWNVVKTDNPHELKKREVQSWLNNQLTYKRHKPAVNSFSRQKILMSYIDQQWDADIMDMSKFAKFNNGYKYLAIFIDIFSRYVWVERMKTKKPKEMVNVMRIVFSEGRKPDYLRTDKGSEFTGGETKLFLRSQQITHFTTVNVIHASYAERFIRTLKGKLYKYFTKHNSYKYIDILQDIVDSYLDATHSSTDMAPSAINKNNAQQVYETLYLPQQLEEEAKPVDFKYQVGDYVHLAVSRRVFHKGYNDTYTPEIFVISHRIRSHPPRYKVKDLLNESVNGSCYEAELQLATYHEDTSFPIEKVLYYTVKNKTRMAKVRWQGYPPKFDSFIDAKDIEKKQIFGKKVKRIKL